jgi:hypothetical protein
MIIIRIDGPEVETFAEKGPSTDLHNAACLDCSFYRMLRMRSMNSSSL